MFGIGCLITLVAGVILEVAGNDLANRANINGVIFGATVLAVASALPEISSGIAAVRLGDNELAVADIFGGNSFQLCLFLVADLIAGKPVLPAAGNLNAWLAVLGIALTAIYAFGVIMRHEPCVARLGRDSILAIVVFASASQASSSSRTDPPTRERPAPGSPRSPTPAHARANSPASTRRVTTPVDGRGSTDARIISDHHVRPRREPGRRGRRPCLLSSPSNSFLVQGQADHAAESGTRR